MAYHLPTAAKQIIRTIGERFPELRKGTDDQRRQLIRTIAEQACYTLGKDWGTKKQTKTNPQSKDSLAWHTASALISWDVINGTTREVQVDGPGEDITGQVFIPVDPVDHIGTPDPDPPVDPTLPLTDPALFYSDVRIDLDEKRKAIARLEVAFSQIRDSLEAAQVALTAMAKESAAQIKTNTTALKSLTTAIKAAVVAMGKVKA